MYQRDDLFDPNFIDERGRTNLERMKQGRAPKGIDGQSINLHHMTQKQNGSIAEVTKTFHQENYSTLHINTGKMPSGINRSKFNNYRKEYWKNRAKDFEP